MKDSAYAELLEFTPINGVLVASNQNAVELMSIVKQGDIQTFQNVSARDLLFHKAYFSLLNFIWCAMPPNFRAKIPCKDFYLFLKMLNNEYDEIYSFKDGKTMIQYHSISFGKMNQTKFREYISNQLPIIYEDLIMQIYKAEQATMVIESIESEYAKFLSKLT